MTYGVCLYDDKEIDVNSFEMKEKISKAFADYILENWNLLVHTETKHACNGYEALFKIDF